MPLRFHRSVSLFPGARLYFSRSGVSVSLGVRGADINLGPRGATLNLGLPGTGLSYRHRLSRPGSPRPLGIATEDTGAVEPPIPRAPEAEASRPLVGEIRSADVAELTSPGLAGLKALINEAAQRRRDLAAALVVHVSARNAAWRELERARKFPLILFRHRSLPRLQERFEAAESTVTERAAEHDGCHIQVDFAFDDVTTQAYSALTAAHASLQRSRCLWDVTSSLAIDRIALRTIASANITRKLVPLGAAHSGIVASRWTGLLFDNANGDPFELYPGFCLVRDRDTRMSTFALIDISQLSVKFTSVRFVEDEPLPSDAAILSYTWLKTNKDGSRDRRFTHNRQIPVVRYGEIVFTSPQGMHEAYMVSNHDAAQAFVAAYLRFQTALSELSRRVEAGAITPDESGGPPSSRRSRLSAMKFHRSRTFLRHMATLLQQPLP